MISLIISKPVDCTNTGSAVHAAERKVVPMNMHVRQFVKDYIKDNNEILCLVRRRSKYAFRVMDSVLTHYGLPKEMKYLAVIESELNPKALSAVGARGPWQLMPETAQELGLNVTPDWDERVSYGKSTVAAAKYLRDLYGEFGDWLLVLAAYNGGPAPVYRAIRRSGSRNFWCLEKYLPAESRDHVKKFIASHYYFEGNGGVTTLTRSEWAAYMDHVHPAQQRLVPGASTMQYASL
jgi:membrane-bound lytic murein transglycosylase D